MHNIHTYQVTTRFVFKGLAQCFFLKNDSLSPQKEKIGGGGICPKCPILDMPLILDFKQFHTCVHSYLINKLNLCLANGHDSNDDTRRHRAKKDMTSAVVKAFQLADEMNILCKF